MTSELLLDIAARSSLLFAGGLAAAAAMRRRSAAERHLVLAVAVIAALALPLGHLTLPQWGWRVWPAVASEARIAVAVETADASPGREEHAASVETPESLPPRIDGAAVIVEILALGSALQAAWLLAGTLRVGGIRRRSRRFDPPCECSADVRLSAETDVAFLTGMLRPVVVLPEAAVSWNAERLRMVLCHELAHLGRGDHWWLLPCGLARVLYWWNPLMWLVLARLRRERERACDDRVIAAFRPSDYAALLVEIATRASSRPRPVLAMAVGSGIGARVKAVLDDSLPRTRTSRGAALGMIGAMLAAAAVLCMVRLVAAESSGDTMAAAPPPPADKGADGAQVEIQTKFLEVSDEAAEKLKPVLAPMLETEGGVSSEVFQNVLREVSEQRGVDLMSAPSVTTKFSNKVVVKVTREFRYGTEFTKTADGRQEPTKFASRDVGVELEVVPTVEDGKILLNGLARLTEFDGMTPGDGGVEMPVFDMKEARFLRELKDGRSVGLWLWHKLDEQVVTDQLADGTRTQIRESVGKRTAFFLTAEIIEAAGGEPTPAQTPRPTASGGVPHGMPVAERPGFVRSPFAPDDGMVDVRGFPSDTEVKCPYTGKIFLVP